MNIIMKKTVALLFLVSTVCPAAAHASVKSDLYAYYTRLDYKIPLSEIRMDTPFSSTEQLLAWRKRWKIPAVPPGAPAITIERARPFVRLGTGLPLSRIQFFCENE